MGNAVAGAGAGGVPASVSTATTIAAQVLPFELLVLVDRSATMFFLDEGRTLTSWEIARQALVGEDGALGQITSEVNATVAYFTYDDTFAGACPLVQATSFEATPMEIEQFFDDYTATVNESGQFQTPTAEGMQAAWGVLEGVPATHPKALLLITDGDPDSCVDINGNCVTDQSIAAAQAAFSADGATLVVGINPLLGNACTGRCGLDFLQDLANAGVGLPVQANTEEFASCVAFDGRDVEGIYAPVGEQAGAAPYVMLNENDPLNAANIVALVQAQLGCAATMDAPSALEEAGATLQIGDDVLGDALEGNWKLAADGTLLIAGTTCSELGAIDGELEIHVVVP